MIVHNVGELVRDRELYSISGDASVYDLSRQLWNHNVGALAVVEGEALVGIVSERDVVMRVVAQKRDPQVMSVRQAMTPDPVTIDEGGRVSDALQLMLEHHFRHLPVMRAGRVAGMVSIRDIPAEYRSMYERFREARRPLSIAT